MQAGLIVDVNGVDLVGGIELDDGEELVDGVDLVADASHALR